MVQSNRCDTYQAAVDDLIARGLAYACTCTRKEVEQAASAPHESLPHEASAYSGTCRDRFKSLEEARKVTGRDPAVRLRVQTGAVPFEDAFRGPEAGVIDGDFVIQKRDGVAAYQLACVLDDAATGITEVLRADDLIPSTPRQLLLFSALGLNPPRYIHTPLLIGSDGRRLAKRHGDTSLHRFRQDGLTPEQVVGYLAFKSGLRPTSAPCESTDLLADFNLSSVPTEPVVVTDSWFTEER